MATILQTTFQRHFLEWNVLYFPLNFTEICSNESNYQYANIGIDDDLLQNRQQSIIWTNVSLVYWHIYASLGVNGLIHFTYQVIQDPDSKVHGANKGPIWGRQDPGGPHVGPMNFFIWGHFKLCFNCGNLLQKADTGIHKQQLDKNHSIVTDYVLYDQDHFNHS